MCTFLRADLTEDLQSILLAFQNGITNEGFADKGATNISLQTYVAGRSNSFDDEQNL